MFDQSRSPAAPADSESRERTDPSVPAQTGEGAVSSTSPRLTQLFERARPRLIARLSPRDAQRLPRKDLAGKVSDILVDILDEEPDPPGLIDQRRLLSLLVDYLLSADPEEVATEAGEDGESDAPHDRAARPAGAAKPSLEDALRRVKPLVLERIDVGAASSLDHAALIRELSGVVAEIREELRLHLNQSEHNELVTALVDDMVGLGPLESLLADPSISDIMVNGPYQVYVERGGKLTLTDIKFQDNQHVMNVATRIVTRVGRRVDESSPICDARLADGSRVNVIAPPLAIDGCSISIRKFSKKSITLDIMSRNATMSAKMAMLLKIAARSRLNILISGGTGSGKTTLLNALSQMIDHGERIVTIEDAAELQLQQPHVVRLETRPPNLEGKGEVTMRGLVKNALRMRPDRIIVGEVRGSEALDMLQAMNTGHEGSMATIHANKPRDALTRLENMVGMAAANLPTKAIRQQISSAVDMIVQVSRMRDGGRRISCVTEVVGMEGDVIVTQDLFTFEFKGEDERGKLRGNFRSAGVRPHFMPRAEYFGLGQALVEIV
jgi:pilus assembly protein CpaF